MTTPEIIATAAIVILAAWTIYLIAADHLRELRAMEDWPELVEWEGHTCDPDYLAAIAEDKTNEAAYDQAVALGNAPRHESILGIIAANEASRLDPDHVDWSAPAKWSER